MQFSLFKSVAEESAPVKENAGDRDGLRPYQRDRVDECMRLLASHRSVVITLHTGAG